MFHVMLDLGCKYGKVSSTCVYSIGSNDLVMGLAGANAVHFPMLMLYMANRLAVEVGCLHQMTADLHVYDRDHHRVAEGASNTEILSGAEVELFFPHEQETFQHELSEFMDLMRRNKPMTFRFFTTKGMRVARELYTVYKQFRSSEDRSKGFIQHLQEGLYEHSPWIEAAKMWLSRRVKNA